VSRLTLRLPESLHQHLCSLAEKEGISLNHYIVYTLTRQVTLVQNSSALAESEKIYREQIARLGMASAAEIEAALSAREVVEPEADLPAEVVSRLKQRVRQRTPGLPR
jgi:hypothetical protein